MSPLGNKETEILILAAAFHDLGIWTHKTFDYIRPSIDLARRYLDIRGMSDEAEKVSRMIENHHKIRKYSGEYELMVENFRRADWIEVSAGYLLFDVNQKQHREITRAFPYYGFHKSITKLTANHFKKHPFNPLPMFKW